MIQATPKLPKTGEERARVIEDVVQRMDEHRAMWLFNMRINMLHMAGFRRFEVANAHTGQVEGHLTGEDGQYLYQDYEILMEQQRIEGRLAGIDVRPAVTTEGRTLQALRERASAQVISDHITSVEALDLAKREFAQIITAIGSCGLSGQVVEHPTIGLISDIEVVHPIEIYPYPVVGYNHWNTHGIIRRRPLPVDNLRELLGTAKVNKAIKSRKVNQWHESLSSPVETSPTGLSQDEGHMSGDPRSRSGRHMIEVNELWVYGPAGTVESYTLTSGCYEFEHTTFDGLEVYPSLVFERFYDDGTFYGLGHYGMRMGSHRQAEVLQTAVFENVRNADKYPMLVLPQGSYKEHTLFENLGGPKIVKYAPDVFGEDFRPFAVPVPNSGTLPAQVLAIAKESGRAVNPLPDLMQDAPARVDSAAAFQFLEQQGSQGFVKPSAAMRRAFSNVHRSLTQQATYQLQMSPQPLTVQRLTLDLAGVIVDNEGNVQFTENPLPNVRRVTFGVKDRSNHSETARRMEAMDLLQRGLTDPQSTLLFLVMEGLDPAAFTDDIKNAVDVVTQNILRLYGDGDNPGEILFAPQLVRADIQLRIVSAFMGGIMMAAASPEVVDAFTDYQEALQQSLGTVVPEGLPNPDEMAAQTAEGMA
jgi:hypothetical protein